MSKRKPTVAAELETIRKKHRGILRPKDVVAFARNAKTALHGRFEWDDHRAAAQHRLERARHLIRFTVRIIPGRKEPITAYVSLEPDRPKGDSYRDIVEVMSDAKLRKQLLVQALRDAEAWAQRYRELKELRPIIAAIGRARKKHR